MVVKKEGVINEIIYDNTVYHNGDYRIYPTLIDFKSLIEEILKSQATSAYIRFIPFYNNAKLNQQIEFDDYMFYMECREQVENEDLKRHIGLCFGKEFIDMSNEDIRLGEILFPLCQNTDIKTYKKSLEIYVEFLDELIPKLMEIAKFKMGLNDEHLAFGYFCFEVQSE